MSEINVKFKRPALEADVVVGSFGELVTLMQAEETTLLKLFGSDMEVIMTSLKGGGTVITEGAIADVVDAAEAGTGRAPRKPRASNKAAEAAAAPAPIAPPAEAPAAPEAAQDDGIPESLRRAPSAPAAAAAPPPPPLLPAAPPVVPAAAPPTGVLVGKVIADLEKRATGSPDGGQGLVDWLADSRIGGLVVKGATFAEAMATLRMTSDDKLTMAASSLGIS